MTWNVIDNVGENTGVGLAQYNGIVRNLDNLFDGNFNYLPASTGAGAAFAATLSSTTSWVLIPELKLQINIDHPTHVIVNWQLPIQYNGGAVSHFQVYVDGATITEDVASHTFIGHTIAVHGVTCTHFIPNLNAGVHTLQVAWKHVGGTAPVIQTTQYYNYQVWGVRA